MTGVVPFTRFGLRRSGPCGLCGTVGPLSHTHVPPRCAGNDGPAQPLVLRPTDDGPSIGPGRVRTGGARAYLLCEPCNNRVGSWDDFFGDFWTCLAGELAQGQGQISPSPVVIEMEKGRPGAVVRSILGGMFAINPGLLTQWPDVAAAVISGAPVDPPADMTLLLELYLGNHGWISGGGAKINPVTGISSYIDSEWVWPPLHVLLTRPNFRGRWPGAMAINGWLADSGTSVRKVSVMMPVVEEESLWADLRTESPVESQE